MIFNASIALMQNKAATGPFPQWISEEPELF
jgi:hypothetical protein